MQLKKATSEVVPFVKRERIIYHRDCLFTNKLNNIVIIILNSQNQVVLNMC